ncbi:MAG TPA: hypothetical protein VJZ91_19235 [Blastocatellia bacterium]|nr:hypothetical protein [Blastocatellia bacterium]
MFNMRVVGLACVMALALGLMAGCNMYETDKANKLVDAANVSIKDANDKGQNCPTRVEQMDDAATKAEDEEGMAKVREQAKAIIADLEKARDGYTDAGNKFLEASKLKLQDKFKEYLDAKGQEMKKRGEMCAALIGVPQALIDSNTAEAYHQKSGAVVTKYQGLQKEADDLEAKASKIYKENEAMFKKS